MCDFNLFTNQISQGKHVFTAECKSHYSDRAQSLTADTLDLPVARKEFGMQGGTFVFIFVGLMVLTGLSQ